MANFTRRAIKETFTALLEERPLNDITVKDIVERCGINRNSFYYHYQDLPALIEEIIKEDAEAIIRAYPSVTSIVEGFDAVVEFASHRRRAILHIYRSVSWDVFEKKLINFEEKFETALAKKIAHFLCTNKYTKAHFVKEKKTAQRRSAAKTAFEPETVSPTPGRKGNRVA